MNALSVIIAVIIAAAAIAAVVYIRKKKILHNCSGNCEGCPGREKCGGAK